MTVYNRLEQTKECISKLNISINRYSNHQAFEYKIYLTDDKSIDGTTAYISSKYPDIELIQGNGSLFWNKGMLKAWQSAYNSGENFDFYLWLNNDTFLYAHAISELFAIYNTSVLHDRRPSVIVGSCESQFQNGQPSYGGSNGDGIIVPNTRELTSCKYINGNVVLIPHNIVEIVGLLSEDFTHAMGDFDYGLRVIKNGFRNIITSKYIGTCERNPIPIWQNPHYSFRQRFFNFISPQGLNFKEYILFRKKHWGIKAIPFAIKAIFTLLFPGICAFFKSKKS